MISVIVPVYNVEKYLDKCIQSILGQTYKDFELIFVDDGSTDCSGDICDRYADKDSRISVIHKENGGPSIARNEAVIQSRGEFITFIDSDDYVALDYLESLYCAIEKNNADISAVLMKEILEDADFRKGKNHRKLKVMSGRKALLNVLYQKDLDTTPCGMLFRRKIVLENPFPEGKYHEDDFTMFKYFEQAKIVVIVEAIMYYYVQHASSIMHQRTRKIIKDEIEASDNLEDYFRKKDGELLKAAKSKKFSNYCQIALCGHDTDLVTFTEFNKVSKYLKKESISEFLNMQVRFKNRMAALIIFLGNTKTLVWINRSILKIAKVLKCRN